jgi:hypothetical protein
VAPGAARPWRVRKKAPRLEPRELTRLFFMVCLRGLERRFERPITEAIQAAREKAYQEGQAQCAARHVDRSSDGDDLAKRHSKLVEKTRAFGEATGLFLDRPYDDARDLGVAVRATQRLAESNGWVERAIESDIKRLTEAMATIKETRANVRRVLGIPDAEASE